MRISRATGAPERVAALNFQRENASVAASLLMGSSPSITREILDRAVHGDAAVQNNHGVRGPRFLGRPSCRTPFPVYRLQSDVLPPLAGPPTLPHIIYRRILMRA